MSKIIVTAAITGNIHVPSMSPYLPITPKQIIDETVRAREAGAAVAHIHARNPEDGTPTTSIDIYGEILSGIKAKSDIVVCITTGGTAEMTAKDRIAVVKKFKPELATFNTGSMNFAIYPLANQIEKFKYSWERGYLEKTESFVFVNTFDMLKHYCNTMKEVNTKPELEVYEIGMINNTVQLINEGFLEKPLYIQFVMGILGGIPAGVDYLLYLYNTASKLIGDFNWSVCAAGRHQLPMGVVNMLLGGNIRVGLEDSLYIERGKLAKSNAEQVEKAVCIARQLGKEPASPYEVRKMLNLKGLDNVSF
jgi:uncharacterized protein (DUF849 family)